MGTLKRVKVAYFLNKNIDLGSSQVLTRMLRFDGSRRYPLMFVARWAVQAGAEAFALVFILRGAGEGAALCFALLSVLGIIAGAIFEDVVKVFKRFKADYVARLSGDAYSSRIDILDAVYWFWLLRRLGAFATAVSFMVMRGHWHAVALVALMVTSGYLIFISKAIFKARLNAISGAVAYLASGGIIALISTWICSALNTVLGEAGRAYTVGEGELLGRTLPDVLFSDLGSTVNAVYSSDAFLVTASAFALLTMLLIVLVRRSRMGSLTDQGFRSEYITSVDAANKGCEGYDRFIIAQLSREVPRFGATEMGFLVPFETWFLTGLLFIVASRAEHVGVVLVLAAVGVQVVLLAVPRAVVSNYPMIFEMGNLLGSLRLFRRLPLAVRKKYYQGMASALRKVTLVPCAILATSVISAMALVACVQGGAWAGAGVLAICSTQFLLSWRFMPGVCLGAQMDAFEVVLQRVRMLDGDESISDLTSFSEYGALRNLRMIPLFSVQTVLVFGVILLPIVGALKGELWWFAGAAASSFLAIGCWLTSRKFGGA